MNTNILEYVIAVAENGQQASAAEQMGITPPALNQQIRKLEKDLGTKLFEHKGGKMALTDAGQIYVNAARFTLNIYNSALEEIASLNKQEKYQLTIVADDSFDGLMPKILESFSAEYPDLSVNLIFASVSTAKEYVRNDMANLAVVMEETSADSYNIECIPIGRTELRLVLSKKDQLTDRLKESFDFSLLENSHFLYNKEEPVLYEHIQEIFDIHHFNPRSYDDISTLKAVSNMAGNGKGITILPSILCHQEDCAVFPIDPPVYVPFSVIHRKDCILTYPQKALIHMIEKALKEN